LDVLIVIGAIATALETGFERAPERSPWIAGAAAGILVLVLLGRHRFAFLAPAAVWLMAASIAFADGRLVVTTAGATAAGLAAAFLLGNLRDAAEARIGLAISLVGSTAVVYNDPQHNAGEFFFVPALFFIGWLAGYALRARGEQAEAAEERALHAERAVFEERVRIARELHDVVAHHVSMMGVQAGAARVVIDSDRDQAKEALSSIEHSSRQAVAELHRLLGFLRQAGDRDDLAPQPSLSELPQLAASMRDSDLAVELIVEGESRPLPPTVELSAYRIVQEALTNTIKHGAASRADVHLRYWPDELELEIVDDGRPNGDTASGPGGLGLIGMRERAALHGGELSAGPVAGGGFAVRARLRAPEAGL
jgi:signal transduction histidine kinase